ncbi:hypothetical protein QOZ80_9BG0714180 [Eleusine coracana subsp. coracana]|nr:hypothetical protein QOZ80_9BG0714180 [Eleusine coracana subsp. coracana]
MADSSDNAADKSSGADAIVSSGEKSEEIAPAAGKRMTRLPDAEVAWVLSWKSEPLKSSSLVSPELLEVSKALNDDFVKHQAWMRAEFEANGGYVEVDDEFLAARAENNRLLEELREQFNTAIDFTGWTFSDCPSDFYLDEDDEDDYEDGEDESDDD